MPDIALVREESTMDTELINELNSLPLGELNVEQRHVAEKAVRKIQEILGPRHPEIPRHLERLARHYEAQGKFGKAETIHRLVLVILERDLPKGDPEVVRALVHLAEFYYCQGHYLEAQPLFSRALAMDEAAYRKTRRDGLVDLGNLARIYMSQIACSLKQGWTRRWPSKS